MGDWGRCSKILLDFILVHDKCKKKTDVNVFRNARVGIGPYLVVEKIRCFRKMVWKLGSIKERLLIRLSELKVTQN